MNTTQRPSPGSPSIVVDLTQAPYHCDPTGQRDCTAALRQAIDDALAEDRALQLAAHQRLSKPGAAPEGPETRSGSLHFHRNTPPATILYLPTGTYRVSGTIGYRWNDLVNYKNGDHLARCIHWKGDGPDHTVIRLQDGCPGFAEGDGRAVLEIMRGVKSAVCMQNSVEGLTIDTGRRNPGAVGLDFYSNNSGAVRDVTVRSSDGQGLAGIAIRKWNSSCAFFQRIQVEGFQYGVQVLHHRLYTVLEDVTVRGQSRCGVWIDQHNVALHRLKSDNRVPALVVSGAAAHVVAIDLQAVGGAEAASAVEVRAGVCFVRDLVATGYGTAIHHRDGFAETSPQVAEWTSHLAVKVFPDQRGGSLRLPVMDAPEVVLADAEWVEVDAPNDGVQDACPGIEAAFASGARGVRFPRGRFLITTPLRIPAHVERVDFGYADLEAGPTLKTLDNRGAFLIGDGQRPLIVERIFTMTGFMGRHRFLEHDGVRDVVLRDLHTQFTAFYRNTVPGSRVFIENCANTTEGSHDLVSFHFTGQQVWARQLNPERSDIQVINDGGTLWVLGFKTENPSVAFLTKNGGTTEILGGIFNQLRAYHPNAKPEPAIINDESAVSVSASTTDFKANRSYEGPAHVMVREIRQGAVRDLPWEVLPLRQPHLVTIPLYVGRPDPVA